MKNLLLLILLTTATFSFGQRAIKDQNLILNNGTDRNVTITMDLGIAGQPKIRYNITTDKWEFTHDNIAWETFAGLEYTNTQLALKAPLASPALTGDPTAPTALAGDSDTSLATTAFVQGELNAHVTDTIDAHDASAISTVATVDLVATDVQGALNELQTDVNTRATSAALATHEADTTTHGTVGNIVGTSDTQTLTQKTIDADLNTLSNIEVADLKTGVLDTDISAVSIAHDTVPSALATKTYIDAGDSANSTALNNHLTDTLDAHDASAISVAAITNLTATDAQQAFTEHQTDIDTLISNVATNTSTIATKANDNAVVHLTGNESIAGVKTFTGRIAAVSTTNGNKPCPDMTDAQMLAVVAPSNGDCVNNTTLNSWLVYDSVEMVWEEIGGGGGISNWVTAEAYAIGDVVIESNKIYQANTAHTSGVFTSDIANWTNIAYGIAAKSDAGTAVTVGDLQFPKSQLTNVGPDSYRVETGNGNLLVNPSFEHLAEGTGWTTSTTSTATMNIAGAVNTTYELGKKHMTFECIGGASGGTCLLFQDQNTSKTIQGLALAYISSTSASAVKLYSRVNQANNLSVTTKSTALGLYKIPFILGSTHSGLGVEVTVAAGQTITGTIDATSVGAQDVKQDIDQSQIAGESYFAGTTGCLWSRTSATLGPYTADVDCPAPTVTHSYMGEWQATDSDLPRQTVNNLPSGTYKATFYLANYNSASINSSHAITDGTSTCEAVLGNASAVPAHTVVSCVFKYSSPGNRSFELHTASSSNTVNIQNGVPAPRGSTKFILEYYGSGQAYSSTNSDTGWESCGHLPSDFTNFGTVTTIETQCKRQGDELLMRGRFTGGTPAAGLGSVALKFQGVYLTAAGTSSIPTIQAAGIWFYDMVDTGHGGTILISPGATGINFSLGGMIGSQSGNPMSPANANNMLGLGNIANMTGIRIPINGWENSNLIVASLSGLESCTDTYECTDTFSAKVSSTGVVSDENLDFINGNCVVATTSEYTCTFNSGLATVPMNCIAQSADFQTSQPHTTLTSTSYTTWDSTTVRRASPAQIFCQRQGADYIGKTAKAVASDQNVRTPGVLNAVLFSMQMDTACAASPCTISSKKGDVITSPTFTRTAVGKYQIPIPVGMLSSAPHCSVTQVTNVSYSYDCEMDSAPVQSATQISVACDNASGTAVDEGFNIVCLGETP